MAQQSRLQALLRSGNAKVAFAAAGCFIPVMGLMVLNGLGFGDFVQVRVLEPIRRSLPGRHPILDDHRQQSAEPTIFEIARRAQLEGGRDGRAGQR